MCVYGGKVGEGILLGEMVCVYGGKVGEGGRGYIGGDGVCVCMGVRQESEGVGILHCICIKYLAEIHLNTQEADTDCRKFELTDLYLKGHMYS